MNEKFVAIDRFIFLEQPAQHYFQIFINTKIHVAVIVIMMDTILHSHQRWMNGWTHPRVDEQTYRNADRVNPNRQ